MVHEGSFNYKQREMSAVMDSNNRMLKRLQNTKSGVSEYAHRTPNDKYKKLVSKFRNPVG